MIYLLAVLGLWVTFCSMVWWALSLAYHSRDRRSPNDR